MDEYKQVGPEKPNYSEDIERIRGMLARNAVSVAFAANMTRFHIVLAWLSITPYDSRPPGFRGQDALFVGLAEGKSAWFGAKFQPIHWSYIAQYLDTPYGDTAEDHPLADFINAVLPAVPGAPEEVEPPAG